MALAPREDVDPVSPVHGYLDDDMGRCAETIQSQPPAFRNVGQTEGAVAYYPGAQQGSDL